VAYAAKLVFRQEAAEPVIAKDRLCIADNSAIAFRHLHVQSKNCNCRNGGNESAMEQSEGRPFFVT
jgi:hypothetical protein